MRYWHLKQMKIRKILKTNAEISVQSISSHLVEKERNHSDQISRKNSIEILKPKADHNNHPTKKITNLEEFLKDESLETWEESVGDQKYQNQIQVNYSKFQFFFIKY